MIVVRMYVNVIVFVLFFDLNNNECENSLYVISVNPPLIWKII